MSRIKTFLNGGFLLPGDVNSLEDDYEYAFSAYRRVAPQQNGEVTGGISGTVSLSSFNEIAFQGASARLDQVFWLDDLDDLRAYTSQSGPMSARAVKYRVLAWAGANAVAPGTTLTFGLYACTFAPGASSLSNLYTIAGSCVPGSVVTVSSLAANTLSAPVSSGDFDAPAAGNYVIGVNFASASAANSKTDLHAIVQARLV